MWFAVVSTIALFAVAVALVRPAGRLLAAWEAYDATVQGSRYHRHREGRSVRETLAEAAKRTREVAAARYAPAPVAPAWADLTVMLPVVA